MSTACAPIHQPPAFHLERLRHPAVLPLELSGIIVDGGTLWEWSQEPDFPQALRAALGSLHSGRAVLQGGAPVPPRVAGFDAVYLTGGRLEQPGWQTKLAGLPFPVLFAENPVFSAALGALAWLQRHARSGWVLDLGSSQLKLVAPGWQRTFPRDWTRLRRRGEITVAQLPAQQRRLREFVAGALQRAKVDAGQTPAALLFALPARLSADGVPASSSYAGMEHETQLPRDIAEQTGLAHVPWMVANDAELAALAVLADRRLAGFRKVLVLTLGFGLGAALVGQV